MVSLITSPDGATEGDDFYVGSGFNTIIALGGDDVVYGDPIRVIEGGGTFANPVSLSNIFFNSLNPDADFDGLKTTTLLRSSGSPGDTWRLLVTNPDARLVLDLDYGNHPFGVPGEFVIDLFGPDGQLLTQSIGTEQRDRGSIVPEAFIDITVPSAG
ncbi:MAG: hypothetical protein AAF501_03115, partial [Pseudomonadota bacterium]